MNSKQVSSEIQFRALTDTNGKSQILFRESVKVLNFGKILSPSDSASKMGHMTKFWPPTHLRRRRYDAKCSKHKCWASYPKTWSNSKNFAFIEFSIQKYPVHVKTTLKCSIILEILDMFYFQNIDDIYLFRLSTYIIYTCLYIEI